MNKLAKFSLMAAFAAAPVMADEDFGGIGVTIYQVPAGVYVAEVIPGGPAADTKIATGDVIVAVDGVSLKGQPLCIGGKVAGHPGNLVRQSVIPLNFCSRHGKIQRQNHGQTPPFML